MRGLLRTLFIVKMMIVHSRTKFHLNLTNHPEAEGEAMETTTSTDIMKEVAKKEQLVIPAVIHII